MNGYRRRLQWRIGRSPRRADGRLRGIAPSVVGHGGKLQNHASGGHRVSGGRSPELGKLGSSCSGCCADLRRSFVEPCSHPWPVPAVPRGSPSHLAREWHGAFAAPSPNLSRRQPATTVGARSDHARVCLAAPSPASATLPMSSARASHGGWPGVTMPQPTRRAHLPSWPPVSSRRHRVPIRSSV